MHLRAVHAGEQVLNLIVLHAPFARTLRFAEWPIATPSLNKPHRRAQAKPIKHGVKVWVLCDSTTGYIYNFYVFTGPRTSASTATEVILDKLMFGRGLEGAGHVLVADNWFSSVRLARALWRRYAAYYVGVHRLTSKKSEIGSDDFQFRKLPNATMGYIEQGTVRQAFRAIPGLKTSVEGSQFDGPKGNCYVEQHAVFKDRKRLVGLLSTAYHGLRNKGDKREQVKRGQKGQPERQLVPALRALVIYIYNMGAVDRADRGVSDYTCSFRTTRWELRIVFWVFDIVCWNCWVITKERIVTDTFPGASSDPGLRKLHISRYGSRERKVDEWGQGNWVFKPKNDGHYSFVRDVGKGLVRIARAAAEEEAAAAGKGVADMFPWIPKRTTPEEARANKAGQPLLDTSQADFGTVHQVTQARSRSQCYACITAEVARSGSTRAEARASGNYEQTTQRCVECKVHLCKHCWDKNWDHQAARCRPAAGLTVSLRVEGKSRMPQRAKHTKKQKN